MTDRSEKILGNPRLPGIRTKDICIKPEQKPGEAAKGDMDRAGQGLFQTKQVNFASQERWE